MQEIYPQYQVGVTIRGFLFFLLFIIGSAGWAQISPEKFALQRMQKAKWAKAEQSLKKSLRRDSLNVEALYVYSRWYFAPGNPYFSIDSAYQYIKASITSFGVSDARQRERLVRFPIDSLVLTNLKNQIDSAAFESAKSLNTEQAYQLFIEKHYDSKQHGIAVELRDEVSFLNALRENTYGSFERYLAKYPKSHRALDAKARYEKLLFEEKTRDGRLSDFVAFYSSYPTSPYRTSALREIFEISTASGRMSDFLNFIDQYGQETPFSKKARDIVYHLAKQEELAIPLQVVSDSLKQEMEIEKGFYVPFFKNGKYGFMNYLGKETIKERFDDVDEEYFCGNISTDFLATNQGVVNRLGEVIFSAPARSVRDLGRGILLIEEENCQRLIHKSGFEVVSDCIEDARLISENFLAVKNHSQQWYLYAFTGRRITNAFYENIDAVEDIIVFTQSGKKILYTIEQVAAAADKAPLVVREVFDEVRKLSSDKILVKNGALEGVINSHLEFVIPLDRQSLTMTSFGFTKKYLNKVTTVGVSDIIDRDEFTDIKPYQNWLGLYKGNDVSLYHLPTAKIIESKMDSLSFTNRLALTFKGDSLKVIFSSGRKMLFPRASRVTFLQSPDSVKYFAIDERGKKNIYDIENGSRRFALECDKIEEIGYGLFLVEEKGRSGLVNNDGKMILPFEYDAIVKSGDHFVSLLKGKRFGIYDLKNRLLVKASFERNLRFYNSSLLVAFREGQYSLIGLDTKPVTDYVFDEIEYWTDSIAWTKSNFRWRLYDIYRGKVIHDNIKDYRLIKNSGEEKIAIIHKDNEYGVLSSTKGMIIQPSFSDVINLGTSDHPLYFTEKHVEEAEIFVVIYYDSKGDMIRREIYEADDYDKIYCR